MKVVKLNQPLPPAPRLTFGQGFAGKLQFQNTLNTIAQATPNLQDPATRNAVVQRIQLLMYATGSDNDFRRWQQWLENTINSPNATWRDLWYCFDSIDRDRGVLQ